MSEGNFNQIKSLRSSMDKLDVKVRRKHGYYKICLGGLLRLICPSGQEWAESSGFTLKL